MSMAIEPQSTGEDWLARLSALSDRSRVRIMRMLEQEELGVGELSRTLAMPQSTVSRHLKPLHELGLVSKRSEGTASLYRISISDAADIALWESTSDRLGDAEDLLDDDARLRQVLLERRGDSRSFFGRVGSEWQTIRRELFGYGFSEEALLGFLPAEWVVADLGCGTGDAAERLAPVVRTVYAVDREESMLDAARKRLESFENVEFLQADLLSIPLDDGTLDAAILMLVLHHQESPADVIREAARAIRPGGQLIIVDMVDHQMAEFIEEMGHLHLGFKQSDISDWAGACNMRMRGYRRLRSSLSGHGPALFAALLVK